MIYRKKLINIYFLTVLSLIPLSILIGSLISLSIIILITLSFFFILFKKDNFLLLKNNSILLLSCLYIYLLFNSMISLDFYLGAERNFGFIRFIFLFIAINYFFFNYKNIDIIFKIWTLVFIIVLFDVSYEFLVGNNLLGFESVNKKRIVSFFKDELIVGSFITGFAFIIIGYLFKNFEKIERYKQTLIYLLMIFIVICLILSGERSNTIRLIIGFIIFLCLNGKIRAKAKLLFFSIISIFFLTLFFSSGYVKHRYYNDLIEKISDKEIRQDYIYFKLYKSGIEVFKKYPIFGVGNKNYRIETCKKSERAINPYICNTHPHQVYVELLSEHGLVGTVLIISIIFFLIMKNFKTMLATRNLLQIGCFSYLVVSLIPVLPSGAFFSDFNSTIFWINFSIYFASNLKTNIFNNDRLT